MQYATFPRRILAGLIDCSLSFLIPLYLNYVLLKTPFYYNVRLWVKILIELSYFVYPWMKYHKTFGMFVTGIEVTTIDGIPLGFKRSILRYFGMYISFTCLGLGFIWMFWDKQRQTWHDKFAGTCVVISKNSKISVQTPKLEIIPLSKRGKTQKIVGKIGLVISTIVLLMYLFVYTLLLIFCPNQEIFWIKMADLTIYFFPFFFFLFLNLVGKDMESNYDPQTIGKVGN